MLESAPQERLVMGFLARLLGVAQPAPNVPDEGPADTDEEQFEAQEAEEARDDG